MYSLDDPIETQGQADEAEALVEAMSKLSGALVLAKRAAESLNKFHQFSATDISEATEATDVAVAYLSARIADTDDALSIWQDKVEGVHNA